MGRGCPRRGPQTPCWLEEAGEGVASGGEGTGMDDAGGGTAPPEAEGNLGSAQTGPQGVFAKSVQRPGPLLRPSRSRNFSTGTLWPHNVHTT